MPTAVRTQDGVFTMTSTSQDIPVAKVKKDNSIVRVMVMSTGGGTNLTSHMVTGYLLDDDTVRFQRGASTSNCQVYWEVIQFDRDVTVQVVSVNHSSGGNINTVINSVVTSRSISFGVGRTSTAPTNGMRDIVCRDRLTTSTELRTNVYQADSNFYNVVHVVEFGTEVSVQRVDQITASSNPIDTTITSVDMASSWVLANMFPYTSANLDSNQIPTSRLLNSTTVRIEHYAGSYQFYHNFYVVSSSDTKVTRGYQGMSTITEYYTTVDCNKKASMVHIVGNNSCISETNVTTEDWGDFGAAIELLSDTSLRWKRYSVTNITYTSWELIEFAYKPRKFMMIT